MPIHIINTIESKLSRFPLIRLSVLLVQKEAYDSIHRTNHQNILKSSAIFS